MQRLLNNGLLFLFVLVAFGACKNRKGASESRLNINENNYEKVLKKKSLDWEYLAISAKVDYKTDPGIPKVDAFVRMKKDEMIWMSVRAMNIELARIKIDNDSIYALMKFPKKEYHVLPVKYVTRYLPGVQGVSEVQKILLNEAPFPVDDYKWIKSEKLDTFFLYKQNDILKNSLSGERKVGRIVDCFVSNLLGNFNANIYYTNPQKVGKKTLPYSLDIKGKADSDTVNILINYKSVTIKDELSFPFKVGDSYERK